jgi:23S rRNA (guanosine2251-2'-O)-methyltransferase
VAGNSQRRGARRDPSSKKGATVGSGGRGRKALEGKGPTPKAEQRPGHVASRRAAAAGKRAGQQGQPGKQRQPRGSGQSRPRSGSSGGGTRKPSPTTEVVAGRNPVVEALRAGVPASALLVMERVDSDDRVREALKAAAAAGLPVLEAPRVELDRLTGGAVHQGLALQVPPYRYAHPDDLLARALESGEPVLLVALDGVTDPRNLGAVVRSAAAFGAHGVLVPERRSAGMTVSAWKTSAGAAARVPVARAPNLARALAAYRKAGVFVVGLDGSGEADVADVDLLAEPVVLVAGSEGRGLSRVVREQCDVVARIPIAASVESLNASVAAGVALYAAGRARRR